jgi:ABC-type nitrate/sulfonate/bicarbonate transport system permease component
VTVTVAPETTVLATQAVVGAPVTAGGSSVSLARRLLRPLMSAVLSLVVICVLWIGFIKLANVSPLVAKSPVSVAKFFWNGGGNGQKSSAIWPLLGRTLWDSLLGILTGLGAAIVVAMAFTVSRLIERTLLPLALTVATVPLVAMAPLFAEIFGRGELGVTVISGLVVFFPALLTVNYGLRTTSKQAAELCRVYGAGSVTIARKVMIPSAMPAIFAAIRIAVPGSLIGAMIAELTASGKGLGYGIQGFANLSSYDLVWASVTVLTFIVVVVYYAVAALETVVLTRFGAPAGRR